MFALTLTAAKTAQLSSDSVCVKESDIERVKTLEKACLPYCRHLVGSLVSCQAMQWYSVSKEFITGLVVVLKCYPSLADVPVHPHLQRSGAADMLTYLHL